MYGGVAAGVVYLANLVTAGGDFTRTWLLVMGAATALAVIADLYKTGKQDKRSDVYIGTIMGAALLIVVVLFIFGFRALGSGGNSPPNDNGSVTPTVANTETPLFTVTPTSSTPEPSNGCGDVDNNDRVDLIDALLVLQFYAKTLATLQSEFSADVNNDGMIDSIDAALILQVSVGLTAADALRCS